MIEPDSASSNEETHLMRVQLIIGAAAVPVLIVMAVSDVLVITFFSLENGWQLALLIANGSRIIGSTFAVVGAIAVIKRNGSRLAWILVAVYCIERAWPYAYVYVIFRGVVAIPDIDLISVVSTIVIAYQYSIILVSLYAWLSIISTVAYRPLYLAYILLYSLSGIATYLVTGIIFGFGRHISYTPADSFALQIPGLIVQILMYLVLFLFFISQLYDSRTTNQLKSDASNFNS